MISPSDAERKYEEFLQSLRDDQPVWTLRNEVGYAKWSTGDPPNIVPFWSSEEQARACSATTFAGYEPESIPAEQFVAEWLDLLAKQGLFVGINLTVEMAGVDVTPDRLREDLHSH